MRYPVPAWLVVAAAAQLAACSGGHSSASLQVSAARPAGIELGHGQRLEADVVTDAGGSGQRSVAFPMDGSNSVVSTHVSGLKPGTHTVAVDYAVDDPRFGKVVIATLQRSLALSTGAHDVDFTRDQPEYLHDDDGVTRLQKLYVGVDPAKPLARFASVSAGLAHSCAIRDDGTLWCWGSNHQGQLGNDAGLGDDGAHAAPAAITGTWNQVSAGDYHSCAVRADGTLWCWGDNGHDQLGFAGDAVAASPHQLGDGADWTQVSAGGDHSCGIRSDRTLWCWGAGGAGQLGVAAAGDLAEPVQVEANDNTWLAVSAGGSHTCALSSSYLIWCWGSNLYGQLGRTTNVGTTQPESVPLSLSGSWNAVSARAFHTCAVGLDATLWCWGDNQSGQLGRTDNLGSDAPNAVPLQLSDPDLVWQAVSAGYRLGCGLVDDGSLWCWGGGTGEVNRLVDVDVRLFVPPQSDAGWQAVSAGGDHTCAIRNEGTLWCWGNNEAGQLGSALPSSVLPAPVAMSAP